MHCLMSLGDLFRMEFGRHVQDPQKTTTDPGIQSQLGIGCGELLKHPGSNCVRACVHAYPRRVNGRHAFVRACARACACVRVSVYAHGPVHVWSVCAQAHALRMLKVLVQLQLGDDKHIIRLDARLIAFQLGAQARGIFAWEVGKGLGWTWIYSLRSSTFVVLCMVLSKHP